MYKDKNILDTRIDGNIGADVLIIQIEPVDSSDCVGQPSPELYHHPAASLGHISMPEQSQGQARKPIGVSRQTKSDRCAPKDFVKLVSVGDN